MIFNELLVKARGKKDLIVQTDLGFASSVSVYDGKLTICNPEKITMETFLDFLDLTEITDISEEEKEWAMEMLEGKLK